MERKTVKREIHALDFAVAELLGNLNALLSDKIEGWDVASGFDYKFEDRTQTHQDVFVSIRPVGWPEPSAINCRFLRGRSVLGGGDSAGWNPYKGSILALHLPKFRMFNFKVDPGDRPDRIKPMDTPSEEAEILNNALRCRGLVT